MTNPVNSLTRVPSSQRALTWQLRQEVRSPSLDNEAIVRVIRRASSTPIGAINR